jgi:hypothetical protein
VTTPAVCHISLDIETLGVRPGSVVLSAAFVRFEDFASCSVNLNIHEQMALGCEVDPQTHSWWGTQPIEAWDAATQNPASLAVALPYFAQWLAWAGGGRPVMIWCHGASFDAPLLAELYRRAGIACPWKYNAIRDTRTLYDLAGVDLREYSAGTAHVALDDALCQTKAAIEALSRLAPKPVRRYFYHTESDCFFFTEDGSAPTDGLVNEIGANEYLLLGGYKPVGAKPGAVVVAINGPSQFKLSK